MNTNNMLANEKCFFIGFNKTATTSLHFYFINHKFTSIHYKNKQHHALNMMLKNVKQKKPILYRLPYQIFLDFLNDQHLDIYKKIYSEHPNAKYVLQIRDKRKWILSRLNFMGGKYVQFLNKKHGLQFTYKQYISIWSKLYDKHILDVKTFFKDRTMNPNFIVYNIDTDPLKKLLDFMGITIKNQTLSKRYGKSKHKFYTIKHILPYLPASHEN